MRWTLTTEEIGDDWRYKENEGNRWRWRHAQGEDVEHELSRLPTIRK